MYFIFTAILTQQKNTLKYDNYYQDNHQFVNYICVTKGNFANFTCKKVLFWVSVLIVWCYLGSGIGSINKAPSPQPVSRTCSMPSNYNSEINLAPHSFW